MPDYQRGYAWEIKEVKEFWNDLNGLTNNKNHYVGVLTLEPVAGAEYKKWIDDIRLIDSKSYRPYYVVDGQQRLAVFRPLKKSKKDWSNCATVCGTIRIQLFYISKLFLE
ncbi:DUF262 domain-containing protein [Lachnoclostridium pacaense]|uniref:DUF262 domain-containing protein n=1 Tax=Enterocloster hominis (ex Hitch et al. 2024) TaxID=1917870 RepID=UPI001D12832C|nr:DUF262 domain-containing protein [Lachnoclostridium pacaense]